MSVKLFTPEACASIVARIEIGQNLSEAAENTGIKPGTVRGWFARGSRETEGAYSDFAAAVAEAQNRPKIEPMTPEEHRAKVSEIARGGSVSALKLYWEMILADRSPAETEEHEEVPLADIDELAQRRAHA